MIQIWFVLQFYQYCGLLVVVVVVFFSFNNESDVIVHFYIRCIINHVFQKNANYVPFFDIYFKCVEPNIQRNVFMETAQFNCPCSWSWCHKNITKSSKTRESKSFISALLFCRDIDKLWIKLCLGSFFGFFLTK